MDMRLGTREFRAQNSDDAERKGKAESSMTYTGRREDKQEGQFDRPRFIGATKKQSRRQQHHEVQQHPIEAMYHQRRQFSRHQFELSPPIVSDEASRRPVGTIPSQAQSRPHRVESTPARPLHERLGQWDDPVQPQEKFRLHHLEPTRPRHIDEAFERPAGTIPTRGQLRPHEFQSTPARRTGFEQLVDQPQLREQLRTHQRESATATYIQALEQQRAAFLSRRQLMLAEDVVGYSQMETTRSGHDNCIACYSSDLHPSDMRRLGCGHNYCFECLRRLFASSVKNESTISTKMLQDTNSIVHC
ncbi:hypothetical protein BJX65DRAFT_186154 [Aspergillus insuetus]